MCSPQSVLSTLAVKIAEMLIQPLTRHVGYLIDYNKNVKDMEAEMKDLGKEIDKIERNVEQAKTLGEVIEVDVRNWLNQAEERKGDFQGFMETKAVKENRRCFKCSCPNFIWRYRLSKQAEEKTTAVKTLVQNSNFQMVSHPAPPPLELQFVSCEDYGTFGSRTPTFMQIMEALKDSDFNVIGIYGTGGVGKTTMVEEVSKKVQRDGLFDEVAMAVVSQNANVSQIQEQLADRLRVKLSATTEGGKAGQLWNRLKNGKKNLIILDDVWQELNLKAIGIPITDGCKVVLTTRRRAVCQSMKVDKDFHIQVLTEPEAWALFEKVVGNSIDSPQMHSVAKEVCKECGGLPVAILAIGAALKDKKNYVWDDALEQLRNSMLKSIEGIESKVYRSLRLSYDYIQLEDAKLCFLLCSLFPEDAHIPIDDLVRYGIGIGFLENADKLKKARNRVLVLVDTLKTSCLLLSGWQEDTVKMHDVIRDVAISIAKDDKAFQVQHGVQEWPKQGTFERSLAISLRSKYIHELPDELLCPQLHTLVLECNSPSLKVPDNFFKGMKELNVLEMIHMRLSPLPSSFGNLVNLRTLSLYGCKLMDTAVLQVLKNLEVLSLRGSNIKELALEIRQLTHLRLLDLQYCEELTLIPPNIISSLFQLEELFISYNFDRWEAEATKQGGTNASLDELNSLTSLTALEIHIPKATSLPRDQILERLVRFKISMGNKFKYLPSGSSRNVLKVDSVPWKSEINILLAKAEVLDLKEMTNENTDDLEHLFGKQRGFLQTQRSQQSPFCKLSKLKVQNCKLKYLFSPSIARELAGLQRLTVRGCESVEEIVRNERGGNDEEVTDRVVIFPQLKRMSLISLPNLRSFYSTRKKEKESITSEGNPLTITEAEPLFNGKVAFPALEKMGIKRLNFIKDIWDHQSFQILPEEEEEESFCQLKSLEVEGCPKLVHVIPSSVLPRLQNLKLLCISNCDSVICEVEGLNSEERSAAVARPTKSLPQLRDLSLRRIPNLRYTGLDKEEFYANLTTLYISNCDSLRNVFSLCSASNLVHLQTLDIKLCSKVEEIVGAAAKGKGEGVVKRSKDDILVFPELNCLRLINLPSLKSFRCSTSGLNEVETAEEVDLDIVIPPTQSLFYHKVAFPKLEMLCFGLVGSNEIDFRHTPADSFCNLRTLQIECCDKVSTGVSLNLLQRSQHLEKLMVMECCLAKEVFDLEGQNVGAGDVELLSEVRLLKLKKLPKLACLWNKNPNGILSFQSLKVVKILECQLLPDLFSSSVATALQRLEYLLVKSCDLMKEIITKEDGIEVADILFPQLRCLALINLPNLLSFCSDNYSFSMPSLKLVVLVRCPKLQTFASGKLNVPKTKIYANPPDKWLWTTDLNKYVHQQISREKGLEIYDDDYDCDDNEDVEKDKLDNYDSEDKYSNNDIKQDSDDDDHE